MKVTIGLPVYNAGPYLLGALRSIFAQTYQDWELIIVDDGSTDGSLEIAQAVQDRRVSVHSDGANRGLIYRLNQIVRLAHCDLLARMDADDLMHPQRLARQVRLLEAQPEVDLVDTAMCSIDLENRPVGVRGLDEICARPATALARAILLHASVVGRTAWFQRHPYDPEYVRAEDHELWYRTVSRSHFARIREPLYFYRESMTSVASYLQSHRSVEKIYRRHGPAEVGWLRTATLVAASRVKGWTYRMFSALGLREWLIALRNRPLLAEEAAAAQAAISEIMATAVPALERRAPHHLLSSPERKAG